MSGLIGKEFTWIQGGNSEGDHYCTGTVIGVVKKGESLFKKFPQNKFDWAYYVVDRSVRYDRAILKNSRYAFIKPEINTVLYRHGKQT